MADFKALPPEDRLLEETPAPAPAVFPPPEEGAAGTAEVDRRGRARGRTAARQRSKSALLLAVAGVALCTVIYAAPVKPADLAPPAETAAAEAIAQSEATQPPVTQPVPAETEPAAPNAAQRLVAVGTWKNDAAGEWVHFNADGTGWWYDGTYFGWMNWAEDEDGGVRYEAAMAYLGPEREHSYDWAPEKEGDTLHSAKGEGVISLEVKEDRFTCPGLLFGTGSYVPDDTPIDASVMEELRGKSVIDLVAGTVWHMESMSDLGIRIYYDSGGVPFYEDVVYVQSLDFAAGVLCCAVSGTGFIVRVPETEQGGDYTGEDGSKTLDIPFTLPAEDAERSLSEFYIYMDPGYGIHHLRDCIPGDAEYNVNQGGWTRGVNSKGSERVYLLFTASGLRLGIDSFDWYPDNYTILAPN